MGVKQVKGSSSLKTKISSTSKSVTSGANKAGVNSKIEKEGRRENEEDENL